MAWFLQQKTMWPKGRRTPQKCMPPCRAQSAPVDGRRQKYRAGAHCPSPGVNRTQLKIPADNDIRAPEVYSKGYEDTMSNH